MVLSRLKNQVLLLKHLNNYAQEVAGTLGKGYFFILIRENMVLNLTEPVGPLRFLGYIW